MTDNPDYDALVVQDIHLQDITSSEHT